MSFSNCLRACSRESNTILPSSDQDYPAQVVHLSNLQLHTRGVVSLDFSGDGKLLCSVGMDDYHMVGIWKWADGELLRKVRGHNADIYAMQFNPYQYIGIPDEVPRAGQAMNEDRACYTLVSYGQRHIKFWTLKKVADPNFTRKFAGDEKTFGNASNKVKSADGRRDEKQYKVPTIWKLDGASGRLGKLGTTQDVTSIAFVDDTAGRRYRNDEGDVVDPETGEIVDFTSSKSGWGPSGRVVATTKRGDIWVFVQPRMPREPSADDEADMYEDENGEVERAPLRGLPMWWELPEDPMESECEYVRWGEYTH